MLEASETRLTPGVSRRFEGHEGRFDVRPKDLERRAVERCRQGREMDQGVRVGRVHHGGDELRIAGFALGPGDAAGPRWGGLGCGGLLGDLRRGRGDQLVQDGRRRHTIHGVDLVPVGQQVRDDVAADPAARAGHADAHQSIPPMARASRRPCM